MIKGASTGIGGLPPQIPGPPQDVSESKATQAAADAKSSSTPESSRATVQPQGKLYEPKGKLGEFQISGNTQQAHLKSLLEDSKTLKPGMKGPEAEKLQDFLISKGYMTGEQKATGPGVFGPKTEAALKAFQKDHGLKDDGILGPKTRKAMAEAERGNRSQMSEVRQGPASAQAEKKGALEHLTPNQPRPELGAKEVPDSKLKTERSLEEQAKLYDKYSSLIPEGKLKDGKNEMNIVGLRHHDIGSSKDLRSYDDRFAVIYRDDAGNKRVRIFEGATHTGQKYVKGDKREDGSYKAKFTDVSGDGKSDIAYIKPGTYDFHLGSSKKYGDHLRPDKNINAWRDTNQDGRIKGDELDGNHKATAVLFHKGGTEVPTSVGCQTMAPTEFDAFMSLIKKDPNDKVSYTLVDASQ